MKASHNDAVGDLFEIQDGANDQCLLKNAFGQFFIRTEIIEKFSGGKWNAISEEEQYKNCCGAFQSKSGRLMRIRESVRKISREDARRWIVETLAPAEFLTDFRRLLKQRISQRKRSSR